MKILPLALQMLTEHPLCHHCLGRQFALLGHRLENSDRGKAMKLLLTLEGLLLRYDIDERNSLSKTITPQESFEKDHNKLPRCNKREGKKEVCYLCGGVFEKIPSIVIKAESKLKGIEFASFLIGIELPYDVAEREDEFKAKFNIAYGESMRSQFSRDIGKQLYQKVEKEVDYSKPDLVILVNPFANQVHLQINPLFVAGQYKKLVRGIPQSRWVCRKCDGKGCAICNWTGKTYQYSVEELVGLPLLRMTRGEEMAFHGAGREDVDARMLGSGRPFVIEIKNPKKRSIDLHELKIKIDSHADGRIKVHDLRFADKEVVRRFKSSESIEKTYSAIIEFGRKVTSEELQNVERTLSKNVIKQRTPKRVLHRRSDLMREKYIYKAITKRLSQNRVEIQIRCQGGLYIKELITGDEGRTNPSVASILDTRATPLQLDVLKVGE